MKTTSLFAPALLCIAMLSGCRQQPAADEQGQRPNIILIMSDDMGYSDLGCYGGEINTPNLDKLAGNGLRFTQFYNTARCCPTRASLLTGLYPHQTGIGHMTNPPEDYQQHDYGLSAYSGRLSHQTRTLAEVLGSGGYTTLMTGKWHLGMADSSYWPLQRGFDRYYGILSGGCNYFRPEYPRGITYQNDTISIDDENYYTTDAFTDKAIEFIGEAGEKTDPFFLYLAYNSPHWPLQAPASDIDKYRNRYLNGWEDLRQERFTKMKELGIIDPELEMSPQDSEDWDALPKEKKEEMALRMAIYAAQVDRMDQNIGKLVSFLEEKGLLNNTIILFMDDNGACAEGGMLGGGPARQLETREGFFLSYGQGWANASNTPFRQYKHWTHEGGIASPMIVHWPAGIAAGRRGSLVKQYGFLPDIMSTFIELSGASYPDSAGGKPLPALQGESLLPLIKGSPGQVHTKPIFWEHEGNKAVRMGKYKLVMKWVDPAVNKWELYDMEKDRTELHDLSGSLPGKVDTLGRLWQEWADTHSVKPWDEIQAIRKAGS